MKKSQFNDYSGSDLWICPMCGASVFAAMQHVGRWHGVSASEFASMFPEIRLSSRAQKIKQAKYERQKRARRCLVRIINCADCGVYVVLPGKGNRTRCHSCRYQKRLELNRIRIVKFQERHPELAKGQYARLSAEQKAKNQKRVKAWTRLDRIRRKSMKSWQCVVCGNDYSPTKNDHRNRYCSPQCRKFVERHSWRRDLLASPEGIAAIRRLRKGGLMVKYAQQLKVLIDKKFSGGSIDESEVQKLLEAVQGPRVARSAPRRGASSDSPNGVRH